MSTLVIPVQYPSFDTELTRRRKETIDLPAVTQFPRNARFENDLASLHSVAIQPDVRIISAVSQLPKISASDSPIVVDVAKILGSKTLIASFSGSERSVKHYCRVYNGRGLRRVVRFLAGATIPKMEVEDLLGSILEDALMATFSHLVTEGSNIVLLNEDEEFVLRTAIAERLPRIYDDEAFMFAERLIRDLKEKIGAEGALAIDDGAVFLNSSRLNIVDVGSIPVKFTVEGLAFHRKEYDLS